MRELQINDVMNVSGGVFELMFASLFTGTIIMGGLYASNNTYYPSYGYNQSSYGYNQSSYGYNQSYIYYDSYPLFDPTYSTIIVDEYYIY
ncbi:MAG: hypothetical protein JSS07_00060 [Proteobacteria bacterium]|nr:hypothetical protein [Pseudomonadota bacterium]